MHECWSTLLNASVIFLNSLRKLNELLPMNVEIMVNIIRSIMPIIPFPPSCERINMVLAFLKLNSVNKPLLNNIKKKMITSIRCVFRDNHSLSLGRKDKKNYNIPP